MSSLGRSIHVRGKGCAHDSIRDLVLIHVPFLSECGRRQTKGIVMTDRTERVPSAFRLNLEQQKNRAKDLLRAVKAGDAEALSRFAAARPSSVTSDSPDALHATAKLADAQFVIARELRFASWSKLKAVLSKITEPKHFMPLRDGSN
jgi:hypothetical protein